MGKILCHNTDPKNRTYITNNAFWRPFPPSIFRGWLSKTVIFYEIRAVALWRTNLRIRHLHSVKSSQCYLHISKIIHEMTEAVYSQYYCNIKYLRLHGYSRHSR